MKITSFKIRNYRTLESIDLDFPSSYAAICGANDCGKTNVVRAIRMLMKEDVGETIFDDEEEFSLKDDYPKWKDTEPGKRQIDLELAITLHRERDAGFYQVVVKQLTLNSPPEILDLVIAVSYRADKPDPWVAVRACGNEYADLNAQEVLKKLQSSKSILFHNSTEIEPRILMRGRGVGGYIREISGQHEQLIGTMKKAVNRGLAKISRAQQAEFENLLGRLQTKYKVGLSLPAFDFGYLPFSITLGDRKVEVPLEDWGSGTKNRTLILLILFRARQIADSEASAGKITPVIVIEEPESFLHPSAQAEFGRVLHDLAEEFQVQVIVTTHSPYLLSIQSPTSNILLTRHVVYKQLRQTERVSITTDNWMAPFAQALGLDTEEFKPWKALILSGSEAILLVEGETDKQYFEMLRNEEHGSHRLWFSGDIVAYEGTGALRNTVLLRFIRNRFRRMFVTFDLDAAGAVEKTLHGLALEKDRDYLALGVNQPGRKNIEGLLPESVFNVVYGSNAALVQAATHGSKEEQESAKGKLKKLFLEEFRKNAKPGTEYFGQFYSIVRAINRAFS